MSPHPLDPAEPDVFDAQLEAAVRGFQQKRGLVADGVVGAQTRRALAYLKAHRPLWVSAVVLVETVWVLTAVYGWSKAQILAMLDTASNSRDFAFQSVGTVRAAARGRPAQAGRPLVFPAA